MSTLSTQPCSSLETNPLLTTKDTKERPGEFKTLLDEPWKVTILPEEPNLPPGVLPAPDPHAAKSLPWRRGDVTRLKDDSPRGMMEYIATHSKGWWQELAERALRDNDKAERLVREAGWQPGQCWALEVDAEAKQKLLDAEEAKRQREEAERAREAAEKEAFMQRQMELLKKAGRAPRCEYLYTDGRGCRAPQVKGERWCHGHAKAMSYRPEKLELELMEDEQAVMVNLYRVTRSLLAGRISEKTAGLMLWSVAIGMPGARKSRARKTYHGGTETRRKGKSLLRIHADDRGSERKQLAQRSRGIARNRNVIARDRKPKSNTKTFATQRNGGSREKRGCASRNLDGSTPRNTGASLAMTTRSAAKPARRGVNHSGVTKRKSFKSGVGRGSTPVIAEIARNRSVIARDRKGKGLPLIKADKRGPEDGQQAGATTQRKALQTSAPSRLRGEASPSTHVHPRKSEVSSCGACVSPRLRGEIAGGAMGSGEGW